MRMAHRITPRIDVNNLLWGVFWILLIAAALVIATGRW